MSNLLLPRGVAAKRAAAAAAKPLEGSAKIDGMQIDVDTPPKIDESRKSTVSGSHPLSSPSTTHSLNPQSTDISKVGRWKDRDQDTTHVKKIQRKPIKPLKPHEIAVLVETAMSDYALWENVNLRRYASDKNTSGYVALSRLLNESSIVAASGATLSEGSILQALKDFGTGAVELQLKVVPAPSSGARFKYATSSAGSYNIRRVDWKLLRYKTEPSSGSTEEMSEAGDFWKRSQEDWERSTIYIENLPRNHWSLPGALAFMRSLTNDINQRSEQAIIMDDESSSSTATFRIQHLELPTHAKAVEGDIPLCKGFAFVTFSSVEEAERLASRWPWYTTHIQGNDEKGVEDSDEDSDIGDELMNLDLSEENNEHKIAVKEATESGFRSMTYHRWTELKNEYTARQDALYEAMRRGISTSSTAATTFRTTQGAAESVSIQTTGSTQPTQNGSRGREIPPHLAPTPQRSVHDPLKKRDQDSDYPHGCLLFIKNVHPQTNKTALKSLFSHILNIAFGSTTTIAPSSSGQGASNSRVDYVDWSKGMSSCHLRLTHPSIARALSTYLGSHNLVQATGEDTVGTPIASSSKPTMSIGDADMTRPLVAELVQGRAEEIYWSKIPEKIRNAAIVKLNKIEVEMALAHGIDGPRGSSVENDEETTAEERKKRRKKA